MNTTTNDYAQCRAVGGPLHGYAFPGHGISAGLTYRTADQVADEPSHYVEYSRRALTRSTPDGLQTSEFFVLDTVKRDGKVIVQGLTDDQALAATLAAPERFWK